MEPKQNYLAVGLFVLASMLKNIGQSLSSAVDDAAAGAEAPAGGRQFPHGLAGQGQRFAARRASKAGRFGGAEGSRAGAKPAGNEIPVDGQIRKSRGWAVWDRARRGGAGAGGA